MFLFDSLLNQTKMIDRNGTISQDFWFPSIEGPASPLLKNIPKSEQWISTPKKGVWTKRIKSRVCPTPKKGVWTKRTKVGCVHVTFPSFEPGSITPQANGFYIGPNRAFENTFLL